MTKFPMAFDSTGRTPRSRSCSLPQSICWRARERERALTQFGRISEQTTDVLSNLDGAKQEGERCRTWLANNKHVHLRLCVFCILRGPTTLGVPPFALRVEWGTQPPSINDFCRSFAVVVVSLPPGSLPLPPITYTIHCHKSPHPLFTRAPSLSPYNLASSPLPLPYRFLAVYQSITWNSNHFGRNLSLRAGGGIMSNKISL